jgi:thymidylate synthase (FAD)
MPKVDLLFLTPNSEPYLELIGRECYQSFDKMIPGSYATFLRNAIERGHESILEHAYATFKFYEVSRAFTHQLVRHRIASMTQQSQRYVSYDKGFGYVIPDTCKEIKFDWVILDPHTEKELARINMNYEKMIDFTRIWYKKLRESGVSPQDARYILPNACHTSIVFTANFREWRTILKLRCDSHAQWEIRNLMLIVLNILHENAPDCFHDLYDKYIGGKNEI